MGGFSRHLSAKKGFKGLCQRLQSWSCSSSVRLLKGRPLWSSVSHRLPQLSQQYKMCLEKIISSWITILQICHLLHAVNAAGRTDLPVDRTRDFLIMQSQVISASVTDVVQCHHGSRSAVPNQGQGPGPHFHGARIFPCLHPDIH